MSRQNDGGPAFPAAIPNNSNGMTLRQWYAGQYLAGVADNMSMTYAQTAEQAFKVADAMIAFEESERETT